MDHIDKLIDMFNNEKNLKLLALDEYLEGVVPFIPGSDMIDFENRKILETYFEPSSEEEREDVLSCITTYMRLMEMNVNSTIIILYSQIESIFLYKITEKRMLRDFKARKKDVKGSSNLFKMCNYINSRFKLYDEDSTEQKVLSFFDEHIRPVRNKLVHETWLLTDIKHAIEFVGEGVNLGRRLQCYHTEKKNYINFLYNITVKVLDMCRKF